MGNADIGVTLIILQVNIVAGFVFFDQVIFQNQGFHFRIGDDVFKINDLLQQGRLFGMIGLRLEVGAHAAAQNCRFSDIEDAVVFILKEIAPRFSRQIL